MVENLEQFYTEATLEDVQYLKSFIDENVEDSNAYVLIKEVYDRYCPIEPLAYKVKGVAMDRSQLESLKEDLIKKDRVLQNNSSSNVGYRIYKTRLY